MLEGFFHQGFIPGPRGKLSSEGQVDPIGETGDSFISCNSVCKMYKEKYIVKYVSINEINIVSFVFLFNFNLLISSILDRILPLLFSVSK